MCIYHKLRQLNIYNENLNVLERYYWNYGCYYINNKEGN